MHHNLHGKKTCFSSSSRLCSAFTYVKGLIELGIILQRAIKLRTLLHCRFWWFGPTVAAMGRMHSKGKGLSRSSLPYKRSPASWVKTTETEVYFQCKLQNHPMHLG